MQYNQAYWTHQVMQSSQPVAPQPVGGQTGTGKRSVLRNLELISKTMYDAVPQVAWQFVVQYYTYMNDKPEQLHRFYTKNSYQLHGVEGEDTLPCQGQQVRFWSLPCPPQS